MIEDKPPSARQSLFIGKANKNFGKNLDNDDVTVVAPKQNIDFEELQAEQEEAEEKLEKYKRNLEEQERKYEGLTPLQKKM